MYFLFLVHNSIHPARPTIRHEHYIYSRNRETYGGKQFIRDLGESQVDSSMLK